ncbi:C-type lectin domain family 4 member A-like [Arvicanthis niloticus]|uniref:C-type lectin domain family 4 member A-like n=1 Tax=Arvicanthis niloticus TaxID=61156 RepID=UPI001486ABF6|nr:C-type lectin domain family 4 member A-like [Arvicanthis niloticus]XP_034368056.1 C-type lectin domain family 4 member A-like [Arvicanthis niloticus]
MASEITYAEVRITNESNASGTHSRCPAAPREKRIHHLSKPGSPSLPFTSLLVLFLLLAITFLVAFIIYFQKYFQLLEVKKGIKDITHKELNCIKNVSLMEDKVWSCCPKDWKPFGSHCYFTSTDLMASWNESKESCSHMGAHLVVIHSQEEQDFITGILNADVGYFIGLLDAGDRQWQWIDQTPYSESAVFWHQGEPNNVYEKCVIINHRKNTKWGWNDIPCSDKHKSVCQMKKMYL